MVLFEVALHIFAGYCCCYFVTMKLLGITPEEFAREFHKAMLRDIECLKSKEEVASDEPKG